MGTGGRAACVIHPAPRAEQADLGAGGESLHRNASLLAGLVVVLLLLALWLSSAHGKRLAFLFGLLAYGLLLMDGLIDGSGPWDAATINGSAGQVLVIFLLAAVIYRTWRGGPLSARQEDRRICPRAARGAGHPGWGGWPCWRRSRICPRRWWPMLACAAVSRAGPPPRAGRRT